MPSQILHFLAGQHAIYQAKLGAEIIDAQAFFLGCQGPDIFSHSRRTKPFALAYSRLLHRRLYGRFCRNVTASLLVEQNATLSSWLYGFVCHQTIDRKLHPYIVNRSFIPGQTGLEGVTPAHLHAFLERNLDVLAFERINESKISACDTEVLSRISGTELAVLVRGISHALIATCPDETRDDNDIELRIGNAFQDAIHFYSITNPVRTSYSSDPECTSIRKFVEFGLSGVALMYPENPDTAIDWMNEANREWLHPIDGHAEFSSVIELFYTAVGESVEILTLLKGVFENGVTLDTFEESIGNECLSVSGSDGKIGTVSYFEPFDLAVSLVAEAEKRREWLARFGC